MNILIVGGSGYVGRALVTRLQGESLVATSGRQSPPPLDARWLQMDLAAPGAASALIAELGDWQPDAMAFCAGMLAGQVETSEALAAAFRLQVELPMRLAQWLAQKPSQQVRNVVMLGGLLPGQSFAMPPAFAAVQGALGATVMALGHELASANVRVNGLALGLLAGGASAAVPADAVARYQNFSALRRLGTAEEVCATLDWLLRKNTVINGKIIACNGGI